jgi:hypothetical protein
MDTMNVGSSFSHAHVNDEICKEEEYDVDEEGEGFIAVLHTGRSANYTIAEEKFLCKIWLTIGMDPTTGTDQTREAYWVRMKEFFDAHNTSGNERTMHSLRSCWSGINTDCQKWAGVQANVDEINPSGTNDTDRVSNSICLLIISTHVCCSIGLILFVCCSSTLFYLLGRTP